MRVIAYTSSSVSTPSFSCRISIVLDQGLPPGDEEVDITKSGELKKKKAEFDWTDFFTSLIVHSRDGFYQQRSVGLGVFHKNQQQLQSRFYHQTKLREEFRNSIFT